MSITPLPDPWLQRWLPLVIQHAQSRKVLEIGCGCGDDTAVLVDAGLSVCAFDLCEGSVATTRLRVPTATVECRNLLEPFPVEEHGAGVVVASLTLHYFPWHQTIELMERVRRTLMPGGIFLCRLNSTDDWNFGASGHPVIEENYFLVDGQPKRFFDERNLQELFAAGWQTLSREHRVSQKYSRKKALWELVLQRSEA